MVPINQDNKPENTPTGTEDDEWTPVENKVFETALAHFYKDPGRWEKVAATLPCKDAAACAQRFELLQKDISDIVEGKVSIPDYKGNRSRTKGSGKGRRGVLWSEDEHRRFLLGLEQCGKGDWRNIARRFVYTRTPSQVASHAQKYFLRLKRGSTGTTGDKRRASINDITSHNGLRCTSFPGNMSFHPIGDPRHSHVQPYHGYLPDTRNTKAFDWRWQGPVILGTNSIWKGVN